MVACPAEQCCPQAGSPRHALQHTGVLSTAVSHLKQPGRLQPALPGAQVGRGLWGLSWSLGAAPGDFSQAKPLSLAVDKGLSSSGVLRQLSRMGRFCGAEQDGVSSSAPQGCGTATPCLALPAPIRSSLAEPAVPALTQAPTLAQQGDPSGAQIVFTTPNVLRI